MCSKQLAVDCMEVINNWETGQKADKYKDMMALEDKYPGVGFAEEAGYLKDGGSKYPKYSPPPRVVAPEPVLIKPVVKKQSVRKNEEMFDTVKSVFQDIGY